MTFVECEDGLFETFAAHGESVFIRVDIWHGAVVSYKVDPYRSLPVICKLGQSGLSVVRVLGVGEEVGVLGRVVGVGGLVVHGVGGHGGHILLGQLPYLIVGDVGVDVAPVVLRVHLPEHLQVIARGHLKPCHAPGVAGEVCAVVQPAPVGDHDPPRGDHFLQLLQTEDLGLGSLMLLGVEVKEECAARRGRGGGNGGGQESSRRKNRDPRGLVGAGVARAKARGDTDDTKQPLKIHCQKVWLYYSKGFLNDQQGFCSKLENWFEQVRNIFVSD